MYRRVHSLGRDRKMSKSHHDDSAEKAGFVQSVTRALNLLELLAEDGEGYRLTDLAERSGLSPSTVHRLLTTMEQRRFVQFDQSDGMWHVGRQSFAVGATFGRRKNFVAQMLPFLRRLRDQTHETVNLAVPNDGEVVVLLQVESREIVRAFTRVGERSPMTASGLGKAILATYSHDEVLAVIQKQGMLRLTANSITRAGDLREELQRVRTQGYAVDDEECAIGLRCIGAVVSNEHGEALASISVSAPAARITDGRLISLGQIVADVAAAITDAVGGRRPQTFEDS
jgi:IclR family acetate operon transcriptional repressor